MKNIQEESSPSSGLYLCCDLAFSAIPAVADTIVPPIQGIPHLFPVLLLW